MKRIIAYASFLLVGICPAAEKEIHLRDLKPDSLELKEVQRRISIMVAKKGPQEVEIIQHEAVSTGSI